MVFIVGFRLWDCEFERCSALAVWRIQTVVLKPTQENVNTDRTITPENPSQDIQAPNNNHIQEPAADPIIYRSLPYVPSLTPKITRILKREFPNVRIASKTINTTAKIIGNNKDPIESMQQSNVVYQVPCTDCPMVYIGMTRNYLRQRMYGHQTDINKYNTMIANGINDTQQQMNEVGGHTALIEHVIKNKHMFDLSEVQIIDRTYKTGNLPILEMCHIANTANTVNRRTDVVGLNIIYAGILHTYKTRLKSKNKSRNDNTDNTNTNETQLVELY